MKTLIKWLCYLYFSTHDVDGLILYDEGEDFGIKIKKEEVGE